MNELLTTSDVNQIIDERFKSLARRLDEEIRKPHYDSSDPFITAVRVAAGAVIISLRDEIG